MPKSSCSSKDDKEWNLRDATAALANSFKISKVAIFFQGHRIAWWSWMLMHKFLLRRSSSSTRAKESAVETMTQMDGQFNRLVKLLVTIITNKVHLQRKGKIVLAMTIRLNFKMTPTGSTA